MNDATPERWRPIPGYEGLYDVSDHGRVKSWRRSADGYILRPHTTVKMGYQRVTLSRPGEPRSARRYVTIHQLVLAAFDKPRPPGMVTRHLNGRAAHNLRGNLTWGTTAENGEDTARHGTLKGIARPRKTHCKHGHPFDEANTYYDSRGRRKCRACGREIWRARGTWKGGIRGEVKTHCKWGHELTPENTRIDKKGSTICRACQREHSRKSRAKAKLKDAA